MINIIKVVLFYSFTVNFPLQFSHCLLFGKLIKLDKNTCNKWQIPKINILIYKYDAKDNFKMEKYDI